MGPRTAGLVVPRVPRLKSLESQSVVRAWIANVKQFCDDMAIPEDQRSAWALSGLEDEAAAAWGSLLYLRKGSSVTFCQMGEILLKQAYQKHSLFSLWSQ